MGAFITHAMNDDGQMVHVDSVPKGIKCGCHCPHCQAPLYAKNGGQIREHHFAHANGHECDGAYESSVHFLAKEVLQETGFIMLPRYGGFGFPTGLVRLRNIEVEKWDERFKIRPDAEGIMPNGERLLIEFNFAHKVDNEKPLFTRGPHGAWDQGGIWLPMIFEHKDKLYMYYEAWGREGFVADRDKDYFRPGISQVGAAVCDKKDFIEWLGLSPNE